jgi:hypothetical protein
MISSIIAFSLLIQLTSASNPDQQSNQSVQEKVHKAEPQSAESVNEAAPQSIDIKSYLAGDVVFMTYVVQLVRIIGVVFLGCAVYKIYKMGSAGWSVTHWHWTKHTLENQLLVALLALAGVVCFVLFQNIKDSDDIINDK